MSGSRSNHHDFWWFGSVESYSGLAWDEVQISPSGGGIICNSVNRMKKMVIFDFIVVNLKYSKPPSF